jgi:flagellar hook-basal body complex protein FliE
MYKLTLNQHCHQLLCGLLGVILFGIIIISFSYFSRSSMNVATVNVTGMVSSFVKETSKQNLTMDQKQEKVNQFGKSMQHVMDDIANRKHIVIMMSEAVIAGSTDLTQEVMMEIKKELKP